MCRNGSKRVWLDNANQFQIRETNNGCMLTYKIEETLEGHKDQFQNMHISRNMEVPVVVYWIKPQSLYERENQSQHKGKNITKNLNENDFGIGLMLMNFCGKGMLS